jgi:hypothetical protein
MPQGLLLKNPIRKLIELQRLVQSSRTEGIHQIYINETPQ